MLAISMLMLPCEVQAVAAICHLSAASRVAALIDGIVMLLDDQTLEGHALPGIKVHSDLAARTFTRKVNWVFIILCLTSSSWSSQVCLMPK